MSAGGPGDDKPYVDSERPDPEIGRPRGGIDSLPSNATQPGGNPKSTQDPGDSAADAPEPSDRLPPAGPHADPALINPDSTPGTGALPSPGEHDDVDTTSS